jgi:Domain of unknown function (DUF4382)
LEKCKDLRRTRHGISSTLALIIAVVVIGAAGIGVYLAFGSLPSGNGTVAIGVRDSPLGSVSHVYLAISGIELQGTGNSTTATYQAAQEKFDLLSLVNVTKMMGNVNVPAGNYSMIRFTIVSAVATIGNTNVTLNVPSGQVKVPIPFQVKSEKTTTIVLDITADQTEISASNNLRPVVTSQVSGPS